MKLLSAYISPNCDIVLHGDIHAGNVSASMDGLTRVHNFIKAESNRLFCMMGDEIEAIKTDDKRYQAETTTEPIPLKQAKHIIENYKSIADRGLAWLSGNHNQTLHRFGNIAE